MATEIEARYIIPDRVLFDRLRSLRRIGSYTLVPVGTAKVTDHYLDTRGRALLHQGWACRLRTENKSWLLSLKGPKTAQGAVVTRPEFEISLPGKIEDVARWPRSEARSRVQELTGGLPLQRLMTIKQRRHRFLVVEGERQVAELSLDQVRVSSQGIHHRSYMLECELLGLGRREDLHQLARFFEEEYALLPETRSKLRRALELIEGGGSPDEGIARRLRPAGVEELLRRYGVDLRLADCVARVASQLYEQLQPVHQLGEGWKELLQVAARLHGIGDVATGGHPDILGRDILLRQPVEGLDPEAQRIVAAAVYLSRKKVTPERIQEVIPAELPKSWRRAALTLTALVRLGRALCTAGGTVEIAQVEQSGEGTRLLLVGERAVRAAHRAQRRSDLWDMAFDHPLIWRAATQRAEEGRIGLDPSDPMQEAARKILRYYLQRMLEHEPGARLGEDAEELHDMRVALRRMRSAIDLLQPYLPADLARECNDGLRRLGRVLGRVRDMDVALQRAWSYLQNNILEERELSPLLSTFRQKRRSGRKQMLRYLRSPGYARLLERLDELIERLGAVPLPQEEAETAGQLAPRYLYLRWRVVQAYEAVLPGAPVELLHTLRIDCKHLRYALEAFREVLPRRVVKLIPEVITLQNHLGDIHDAAVTISMIDQLLDGLPHDEEGLRNYRQACQEEMLAGIEAFPQVWAHFARPKVWKGFELLRPH